MATSNPRLAVRALILHQNRLLLVNAWHADKSDLWCAPGGGVVAGQSLPENLIREVHEETGLFIEIESPALVNEFHDPPTGYHQIEIFFRCRIASGALSDSWTDPEGVVTRRRFFDRADLDLGRIRFKPDSLAEVAWGAGFLYDPLELLAK